MFVKDNIIPHIRICKTSKDTWDKLKGLYETSDSNRILFLKTKLLSIKMDVNETMNKYLSHIKYLRDNLGDIGEEVSSTDLVFITLKGPLRDYKIFISSLVARQTPPTFTKLSGILIQEEERMKMCKHESQTLDQELMERGRYPHKGNQQNPHIGRFHARHRGIPHIESSPNKEVVCHYYGKSGHIAKYCFNTISNYSNNRYRKHNGNYVRKDTPYVNGFKNLRLFLSEHALSIDTDDENAWFIDLGASTHMSYNRDWYDEYYEKFDGTHNYLGDNRSHKVLCYGVISVNLLDGQFKDIHNVMYVLGIKRT